MSNVRVRTAQIMNMMSFIASVSQPETAREYRTMCTLKLLLLGGSRKLYLAGTIYSRDLKFLHVIYETFGCDLTQGFLFHKNVCYKNIYLLTSIIECSAQAQVFYCKLRHQGCSSAHRQVFYRNIRNQG